MAVQFTDYVQLLQDLEQTLRDLTALQPEKIAAVRAHDLEVLNDCMKREQAASLALRGLEQKRANMAKALGVGGEHDLRIPAHGLEVGLPLVEGGLVDTTCQHQRQDAKWYELPHAFSTRRATCWSATSTASPLFSSTA